MLYDLFGGWMTDKQREGLAHGREVRMRWGAMRREIESGQFAGGLEEALRDPRAGSGRVLVMLGVFKKKYGPGLAREQMMGALGLDKQALCRELNEDQIRGLVDGRAALPDVPGGRNPETWRTVEDERAHVVEALRRAAVRQAANERSRERQRERRAEDRDRRRREAVAAGTAMTAVTPETPEGARLRELSAAMREETRRRRAGEDVGTIREAMREARGSLEGARGGSPGVRRMWEGD